MGTKLLQRKIVKEVAKFDFSKLSDSEIKNKTEEFKTRLNNGEKLDNIIFEAFALVKEAAKRTLGLEFFDVQLLGGYILNTGAVAEMSTGAGKTFTATLPLYLNALTSRGVHLVTVNDYLAKRDCEWMAPVYDMLGVSYGYIIHDTPQNKRKDIYDKDIVYITNSELGFDYLRDNMVHKIEDKIQRGYFNFAIIDEVDSILIDESRTPLIISTQGKESSDIYKTCNLFVNSLDKNDVEKDEESNQWILTESGVKKCERKFGLKNYSDPENMELRHFVEQAIKANFEMQRDKQYIVKDNKIILIDEHTGRTADGRRYNEGLHQAIEAKEGVEVKNESITLAQITYQNFFKQYDKFSGMTGTAMTEKKEFKEIYGLKVINIPDNKPNIRIDNKDLIYISEKAKIDAIVADVKEQHAKHRPVLIGTLDIKKSEILSDRLKKEGIRHNLLNAKQNEQEAEIVAQAGQLDAVTIATNMAGRGTDIKLGEGVKELGGLKIIASERAIDRRIDNQLIGRAGRQGDPGESQFYLSLNDELMEQATGSNKDKIANLNKDDLDPIDSKIFTNLIYSCQKKIESRHFETRKNTTKFDTILNNQRINIYEQRDYVLNNDCTDLVKNMITNVLTVENNNNTNLKKVFNLDSADLESAISLAGKKFDEYIKLIDNPAHLSEIIVRVVDAYWVRYMEDVKILRQDVRGAGYRNEDPVQAFNRESTKMFEQLNYNIKKDIVRNILINL